MLQLVMTADGSKTIFNSEVGENYHSRHGALQESRHVFLNSGLKYYLQHRQAADISVLEVGFGTGLNFLLSADYCNDNQIKLDYTGIEAYPLTETLIGQTEYHRYLSAPVWSSFISHYSDALSRAVQIGAFSRLQIAHCELLNFRHDQLFDVVYFDAFASIHQPEMWNQQAITHTVSLLKPGGVFVTYAITGNLKRMLSALGLRVEKAPGAAGKREMLRALKPAD